MRSDNPPVRRTKIVVTIGPSTRSPEMLARLIDAGMDVARLNFSHGSHSFHREVISTVRRLSVEKHRPVAILQDLQGIKIRTGDIDGPDPVELKSGQQFTITTRDVPGNREIVSTSYQSLPKDLRSGERVLLSDGLIELEVLSCGATDVLCRVISGGSLAAHQGINIPGVMISAPSLTAKDLEDLKFGIEHEVDYVALSFVRRPRDVEDLKARLQEAGREIPVIAKLEKPKAIENLEAILDSCEGVMVARGDLGVELSPEKVPGIQKRIIHEANQKAKLVITATQMLESMINHPRPTRAEASDVANAILDGTDAVMLSGETASGEYPVESVQMMSKIILEAEKLGVGSPLQGDDREGLSFPEAVCDAAFHASRSIRTRAIVAFTQTGSTARLISKYRPETEILGFTPHAGIMNRMCLFWGVKPMLMEEITNVDELIQQVERILLDHDLVRPGENLIILTGAPIMERGHTSLMKLHSVGNVKTSSARK